MANVREILTEWGLPSGTPSRTVMYFDATVALATQRSALNTFWDGVGPYCATSVSNGISISGRELDVASGVLTGQWSTATIHTMVGTGGSQPIPDASQALVRWTTGTIVSGRFLNGRTFIPGIGTGILSAGNMGSAALTAITAAANVLAASGAGLQVWHRPIAGSGGSVAAVTAGTLQAELAVLRRRRN